jgi:hypothetical protein
VSLSTFPQRSPFRVPDRERFDFGRALADAFDRRVRLRELRESIEVADRLDDDAPRAEAHRLRRERLSLAVGRFAPDGELIARVDSWAASQTAATIDELTAAVVVVETTTVGGHP